MKSMVAVTRTAAGLILASLLFTLLAACGQTETLTVGVNDGYKPFGYEENGRIRGFEIELWEALAEEAGLQYELRPLSSGELLSALKKRSVDAAIAAVTVKESRKKSFDFSTPYLYTGQALLVHQENNDIQHVNDLKDKTVATKIGTTGYEYASKVKGVGEIQAFPDIEAAFQALLAKKVDAVIYDEPGVKYFAQYEGKGKVKTVGDRLTREHYSITFPKGSRYSGRINNALRTLAKDGTFERIYMKWFGQRPESLPRE